MYLTKKKEINDSIVFGNIVVQTFELEEKSSERY
jgi:hypothetical protein